MHRRRTPIHKAGLVSENGDLSAICFDPPRPINFEIETCLTSHALDDEVTCPNCMEIMGVNQEPSLSSLLRDGIERCLDSYLFVVDFIELNKEREAVGSEPLDGDRYADAMKEFEAFANMNVQVMDKIRKRMEPAKSWGWPSLLEEGDEKRARDR